MSTRSKTEQLQELAQQVQRIIDMPADEACSGCGEIDEWEIKFDLIFEIASEVRELGFSIDYYDPDTSYEEDARAYAQALKEFTAKPAPCSGSAVSFADLQRLQRGVHRMSIEDFSQALAKSIGANRDYARGCWAHFQDNPLGYMISRRPEKQGEELMQVAWEKGGEP